MGSSEQRSTAWQPMALTCHQTIGSWRAALPVSTWPCARAFEETICGSSAMSVWIHWRSQMTNCQCWACAAKRFVWYESRYCSRSTPRLENLSEKRLCRSLAVSCAIIVR